MHMVKANQFYDWERVRVWWERGCILFRLSNCTLHFTSLYKVINLLKIVTNIHYFELHMNTNVVQKHFSCSFPLPVIQWHVIVLVITIDAWNKKWEEWLFSTFLYFYRCRFSKLIIIDNLIRQNNTNPSVIHHIVF